MRNSIVKLPYNFRLDESLWKRIDLSSKTLGPGVLGHVLNRGVAVLRLAKSEVSFKYCFLVNVQLYKYL